ALGLGGIDPGSRRLRGKRHGAAGGEAAAAAWNDDGVERDAERPRLRRDLQPGGALARHDAVVVEGRDERRAALGGDAPADLLAALAVAVVEHDLGAVAARIG